MFKKLASKEQTKRRTNKKKVPDTFLANRFVFLFLVYKIILSILFADMPETNTNFIFLQVIASPLIPIIIYFMATKKKVTDVLPTKKLSRKNLFLLVALGFVVQPAMSFISLASSYLAKNPTQDLIPLFKSIPMAVVIFLVAVMPAVLEEISFRGIIFSGYKNIKLDKTLVFNGLLFSLMHLNLQQSLYAMIMGVVFCVLVYHTQSIYSSMIVHFIFNATQIIKLYLLANVPSAIPFFNLSMKNVYLYFLFKLLMAVISLCVSFIIVKNIIKNEDKNSRDDYSRDSEKFLSPSLISYMAISIFIMCLTS